MPQNESDIEIINIESDDEEEKTKLRVVVHSVADLQIGGSPCFPSILSLQVLPSTSRMIPCNCGQNVVTLGSNGNQQPLILNLSSHNLQTDVKPTEISKCRQLAGRKPNKRLPDENIDHPRTSIKQIKESRTKILQPGFRHDATEKSGQISERRVPGETKTSADIKIEDNAPNTSDFTSQELNSFLKVESNTPTIIVESDEEMQEPSANPSLVENPKQAIFDSKNLRKTPVVILTDCANLLENSKATTPLAKNINFGTKKPKDGENPSKVREDFPPAIASSSKIVEAGHSSKATTKLAKSTNCVTKKPKDGENPSKIRENVTPAIASKYRCIVCTKTFTIFSELQKHATLEHPNTPFLNCNLCGDSFFTFDELVLHFADDYNHVVDGTRAKLSTKRRIAAFALSKRWVINRKPGRPRVNCPKPEHVEANTRTPESTSSVTPYHLCETCRELEFLMKQLSRQFIDSEDKKISVICPFCSLSFITLFGLKKHVSNAHLSCLKQNCKSATI